MGGEAMPILYIFLMTLYSQNADCQLQRLNCAMTPPTFQYLQVHGIIRRSSSFNTGRIDHIYKDRHTTGVKVCVEFFWQEMLWVLNFVPAQLQFAIMCHVPSDEWSLMQFATMCHVSRYEWPLIQFAMMCYVREMKGH